MTRNAPDTIVSSASSLDLARRTAEKTARFIAGRNSDAADELIQETMLVVLSARPRESDKLAPWVAAIARNCHRYRCYRQHRRAVGLGWRRSSEEPRASVADEPDWRAIQGESSRRIGVLLSRLSQDHQVVVRLRVLEGLSGPETARRLCISPHTVQSRYRRALLRLRDLL